MRLLSLGALVMAACSGSQPTELPAAASRRQIEAEQRGKVFGLASELLAERTALSRYRELAERATGALLTPFVDERGAPLLNAAGGGVRGTCGVTFVSPSYAVTAAHCVNSTTADLQQLEVEMYRSSSALEWNYLVAAQLNGRFPEFSHAELGAADGYQMARFGCTLVSRCSEQYGGRFACPLDASPNADAALLRCDGAPGKLYGWVELADTDEATAEVFMPWKHEIYVGPNDPGSDFMNHYVLAGNAPEENYHYFGTDQFGHRQNQLLPLVSLDLVAGVPHRKVAISSESVITDVLGCHGSSGSGALQPSRDGRFQLLGPMIGGNHEHDTYLCNHVPALDGFSREPGSLGVSYGALAITQRLLAGAAESLELDCESVWSEASSLYTFQSCGGKQPSWGELGLSRAAQKVSYLPERSLRVAPGGSLEISMLTLSADSPYRFGFRIDDAASSCVADCPSVRVQVHGVDVLSQRLTLGPGWFAFPLRSPAGGAVTLRFDAGSATELELSEITLRPEARVNSFDTLLERAEASLSDADAASTPPQPMRFVGDAKQGFAARLLPRERLLVSRQALVPGRAWSARFSVTSAAALDCGFVDSAGLRLLSRDCSSGLAELDASGLSAGAAVAFFIEASAASQPVEIDDLTLTSNADSEPECESELSRPGAPALRELCACRFEASPLGCQALRVAVGASRSAHPPIDARR